MSLFGRKLRPEPPSGGAFCLESIEARVLLSTVSPEIVDLAWNGITARAWSDEYVLRLASDTVSTDAVEASLADRGYAGVVCERLGPGRFAGLRAPGATAGDLSAWAGTEPLVQYVEPDFLLANQPTADSLIPSDGGFGSLWGLHNTGQSGGTADADIDAPEAWALTTGSSDVVVAVIDTGFDYTHPDLMPNVWTNSGEIPGDGLDNDNNGYVDDVHGWDFCNDDSDPMDGHGHGTHVSGTIGASGNDGGVVGVNWDVRIMGLKFLSDEGSGSTTDAIRAINYATLMKQAHGVNVVATNNSWGGGGYSSALQDAIAAGGEAGILFVAAAGNDSLDNDSTPHHPSNYDLDCVISVASSTRDDGQSSFSNYGETSVDLAAPGSSILSTYLNDGYAYCSGTSMATPHVAGAVALMASHDPGASPAEIKAAILSSVDPMPAMAGRSVTQGRLNVHGALGQLSVPAPLPDLSVASVDLPEGSVAQGSSLSLDVTVANSGGGAVESGEPLELEARLSGDEVWGNADDVVLFAGTAGGGVPAGQSVGYRVDSVIPADLAPGEYFVAVRLDGRGAIEEEDETNNAWWSDGAALVIVEDAPENHFALEGETLTVTGTAGDDTFRTRLGLAGISGHVARLNQWSYVYDPAAVHTIRLVGAGGWDAVEIFGTDLDETAVLGADGSGSMSNEHDAVEFEGAAQVNAYGRGGADTVRFLDSPGDDQFVQTPTYGYLVGPSAFLFASQFESVEAVAAAGGGDFAGLYDTAGDDCLTASPGHTLLESPTLTCETSGFGYVHVRSVYGGFDVAEIDGSGGDDLFVAQPNSSLMVSPGFQNAVSGFDRVTGRAAGGDDLAYLYDSPGDDTLLVQDGVAEFTGEGFALEAEGFRRAFAFSRWGDDIALLHDSPGDDVFEATPDYGTLSVDNAYYFAAGFGEIHAYATAGGRNYARLHDSMGDDCFVACESHGQLSGAGFFNYAEGFDEVRASARNGGTDTAHLYGTAGNDSLLATPTYASFGNGSFANHAMAFDQVYAYGEGGDDVARLYDSAGDDRFVGGPDQSYMLGDGFMNTAVGFARVFAHAEAGGHDIAQLFDSAGNDVFVGSRNQGQISGDGFLARAQTFEQVYAYAVNGGNDLATLYDSAGDDLYYGRENFGYLQGEGFFHRADSFETTQLFGTRGGTNVLDVLGLTHTLHAYGTWQPA